MKGKWNKRIGITLATTGLLALTSLSSATLFHHSNETTHINQCNKAVADEPIVGVTTKLKPELINGSLDIKGIQTRNVEIYPSNWNFTFQNGVVGSISSEVWLPNFHNDAQAIYHWYQIDNNGVPKEIISLDQTTTDILKFIPKASDNETEIFLRIDFVTNDSNIKYDPFESDRIKIWTSDEPQPEGVPYEIFGVRKLYDNPKTNSGKFDYGIYAQELTVNQIKKSLLAPLNMKYYYDNLPDDYVKRASADKNLIPILPNSNPKFNNIGRWASADINLRYALVNGKKTTNYAELQAVEANIKFFNFKEIRKTFIDPLSSERMDPRSNCTNIVSKFDIDDTKTLTLYAQSYLLIDGLELNPDINKVTKITVLRNTEENTVIEFRIKNVNVEVISNGVNDIIVKDAVVQETIQGYKPGWRPDAITTSVKMYEYIPGSPNTGWISTQRLTTYDNESATITLAAKILISTLIAFGAIICLCIIYIVHTSKKTRLQDRVII